MTLGGWLTMLAVVLAFSLYGARRHRGIARLLFVGYGVLAGVVAGIVVSKWSAYFRTIGEIGS